MWKNKGKVASEEENPVTTQQFLAEWSQKCGMWFWYSRAKHVAKM